MDGGNDHDGDEGGGGDGLIASLTHCRPKLRAEPIVTYDHLLTLRNITMSLEFFPCKIPIPYDASYVYDAWSVLVKSYSKSIVATTHGIVLVVGPIS